MSRSTISTFQLFALYPDEDEASGWARRKCSMSGCPVNVMQDGSVISRFQADGLPDRRGLVAAIVA